MERTSSSIWIGEPGSAQRVRDGAHACPQCGVGGTSIGVASRGSACSGTPIARAGAMRTAGSARGAPGRAASTPAGRSSRSSVVPTSSAGELSHVSCSRVPTQRPASASSTPSK
eukprot:109984-Prymnesium_polylepis.2